MGLFKFLKEKIAKKNQKETETYVSGMSKSRENFANKLDELSKRYKEVNQEYFEQLEEILIEADVGVSLTLRIRLPFSVFITVTVLPTVKPRFAR